MNFAITGRPAPAEAIVLSAGLGGHAAFWTPQIVPLEAHFRVVQYDHRGTGGNPAALPDDYAIGDMADDVLGILDDAGIERAHFLGHALGGLVGLDIARRRPERLGRMILVNAWAKADRHTERCFDIRLGILRTQGPAAYVAAQPLFLHTAPYLSVHHEAILAEIERGTRHFQGVDTLSKRIAALRRFDASGDLGAITTPTLVAAARDDLLVPWTASQALADAMPAARMFTTVAGGHAFTVEDPAPFNDAMLDFLLPERPALRPFNDGSGAA